MSEIKRDLSITEICQGYDNRPECLIEILHVVQRLNGFLSNEQLITIAFSLNLTRAEVHGVASFYHDFRMAPVGKKIVQICMAEACQAVGCQSIKDHAEKTLEVDLGETSADGRVYLQPVYCLGNCALGPAVMINDELYGRVTVERFNSLIMDTNR
ncbi:MAG: NADH-quinone oxidoreductase subunit NuoE [Rhodospirillaceae bacterium]